MENFAYGEINERSFSNPHPWLVESISIMISGPLVGCGDYLQQQSTFP